MTKKEKEETPKVSATDAAIAQIKKQFGEASIQINGTLPGIDFINSGSVALNNALGGGWAVGRIIELLGNESSGKTTACLHAIAEVQRQGHKAAFIDAEQALDPSYARNLGVNMKNLIVSQPDTGEQGLEITDILTRTGEIRLIVIDSVAALVPEAEIEGTMSDQQMGLQARLMSKAMRKLTPITARNKTTVIFTNQWRQKIGLYAGRAVPGGNALKFYASQRVELTPPLSGEKVLKEDNRVVAVNIVAKVIKNKVAPPHQQAELTIRYGEGFDIYTDVIKTAIEKGCLIKGGGGWYKIGEENIARGEPALRELLKADKELFDKLSQ